MALQQTETYKGSVEFSGYWALGPMTIDPLRKESKVQLALYWNIESYNVSAQNFLKLSDTYTITGAEYDAIFPQGIPPEDMPSLAVIMFNIFAFIKAAPQFDGSPSYFANAEIVP